MDWKLELVVLPVADVDRAKAFYLEQAASTCSWIIARGRPSGWSRSPRRARRAPLPSWPTPGPPARSRASTSSSTTSTPHTTTSPPVGPDRARSSTSTPGRRSGPRPRAPGLQLVPQFRRPRRQRLAGPRSAGVLRPGRGERPGLSRVLAAGPGRSAAVGAERRRCQDTMRVGTTLAGALSAWVLDTE